MIEEKETFLGVAVAIFFALLMIFAAISQI